MKQANLVTKTDFDKNQQAFIKKLLQIKHYIFRSPKQVK